MIIDWLTETLRTILSAQLPYLWMILLSIGLFCMLFAVMFVNIKNGPVGWLAFVITAGVLIYGLCWLSHENYVLPENKELNGQTAVVLRVTQNGLRLDTGDTVMPAGITFLTRRDRQYREMLRELEKVINKQPVTLEQKMIPEGYQVCAHDGTDLAEHLLRKGLARAGAGASDTQRRLQFEAQESRVGVWQQAWQGKTPGPFAAALRTFGRACLFSALLWSFLFWMVTTAADWKEQAELAVSCKKLALELREKDHDEESKAGSGNT